MGEDDWVELDFIPIVTSAITGGGPRCSRFFCQMGSESSRTTYVHANLQATVLSENDRRSWYDG
jgi:hypothetical protein